MSASTMVESSMVAEVTLLAVARAPRPWLAIDVTGPDSLEVATAAVLEMSASTMVESSMVAEVTLLAFASAPRP
jgi:hypothetical protein